MSEKKLVIKGGPTSDSIQVLWGDEPINCFIEKIEFCPVDACNLLKAKLTVYVDAIELTALADEPIAHLHPNSPGKEAFKELQEAAKR